MFLLVVVSREAPHEALICPAPAVGVQAELPAGVEAPGVPVCQVARGRSRAEPDTHTPVASVPSHRSASTHSRLPAPGSNIMLTAKLCHNLWEVNC